MKKSEYMLARREFHRAGLATEPRVYRDVQAAEAAGVVWDPEEEPLPERLHLECDIAFEPGSVPAAYAMLQAVFTQSFPRQGERACKILREAVRRWNAWPELRRLAQLLRRDTSTSGRTLRPVRKKLLAILDGREGE
jgi:hypothetical protein